MVADRSAIDLAIGIAGVLVWACIGFAILWALAMTVGRVFVWLITWPWLAWQSIKEQSGRKKPRKPYDWELDRGL